MTEPQTTTFSRVDNSIFYTAFDYPPLDPARLEIRLLKIDAYGFDRHELISNVSLRHTPAFAALSYVCGPPTNTVPITVGGLKFNAFASLAAAIAEVRLCWQRAFPGRELLLWTDQVCINQSDDDERSQQVSSMRDIYSQAKYTLISLPAFIDVGYDFQDWSACKEWLVQQRSNMHATSEFVRNRDAEDPTMQAVQPSSQLVKDIAIAVHEVYALGKSEWWTRAWVFQEFMVSESALFMVKPFFVPWEDIFELLQLYYSSWDLFSQWRYDMEDYLNQEQVQIRAHMHLKGLIPYCGSSCDFCHILYDMYTDYHEKAWDYFDSLPKQYSDVLTAFAGHYIGFMSVFEDKQNLGLQLPLSTVMKRSRTRKTSEPRDKVYAYLGLLRIPALSCPITGKG